MSGREWQPGDVLQHPEFGRGLVVRYDNLGCPSGHRHTPLHVHYGDGEWDHINESRFRPLVVIDPEDREQVERLALAYWGGGGVGVEYFQAALREFADPTPPKPEEPTDPKALVTDRRDNVWRLLADGRWVCTSGPDIGEYLAWDRLASERGPVEVSA